MGAAVGFGGPQFQSQSTFVLGLQPIGAKVLGDSRLLIDNCNKLGDDTDSATHYASDTRNSETTVHVTEGAEGCLNPHYKILIRE